MGFFEFLKGNLSKMISVSEVSDSCKGKEILIESSVPEYCRVGELVFEKRYEEAIQLGLKILEETPCDCGVHINLMDAYFKGRKLNEDYYDRSTYHAKMAILYGHNSGYAYDRLAKNLDKGKLFHQSVQLYNLILNTKGFHFSPHGMGNGIDFSKRRNAVIAKMDKAVDSDDDVLFTQEDINQIIQNIKEQDENERLLNERYEQRMRQMRMEFYKNM